MFIIHNQIILSNRYRVNMPPWETVLCAWNAHKKSNAQAALFLTVKVYGDHSSPLSPALHTFNIPCKRKSHKAFEH